MACNQDQSRTVHIQVKTRSAGRAWQGSIRAGKRMKSPATPLDETVFWVLVDLGDVDTPPRYWVVPDWWIRNDIYRAHKAYLGKHGGKRARNPKATHHAIDERRLKDWQGRWDILGIFK